MKFNLFAVSNTSKMSIDLFLMFSAYCILFPKSNNSQRHKIWNRHTLVHCYSSNPKLSLMKIALLRSIMSGAGTIQDCFMLFQGWRMRTDQLYIDDVCRLRRGTLKAGMLHFDLYMHSSHFFGGLFISKWKKNYACTWACKVTMCAWCCQLC